MATKKIIVSNEIIANSAASYNELDDTPTVNTIPLRGNITTDELGIYSKNEVDILINSMRSIKVVTALPMFPEPNTQYYVGPDAEGKYKIYLYDSDGNIVPLGDSVVNLEAYQEKVPSHKDASGNTIYDIGQNQEGDGWEIKSHDVTNAIKELDTWGQKMQEKVDNNLKTTSKSVVGAINEIKESQSQYQTTTDNNLVTADKTIVGAINSLSTNPAIILPIYEHFIQLRLMDDTNKYLLIGIPYILTNSNGELTAKQVAQHIKTRLWCPITWGYYDIDDPDKFYDATKIVKNSIFEYQESTDEIFFSGITSKYKKFSAGTLTNPKFSINRQVATQALFT